MSPSKPSAFTIYDASAGSGKTFALVKKYLSLVLSQPQPDYFKSILAITFTNKAVAEMKQRIVNSLIEFTNEKVSPGPMMLEIMEDTGLCQDQLMQRSKSVLNQLLNHYTQFSVETIDHFNHRLIRTFAKDLKLSTNFEVSLETSDWIAQAVDLLLDQVGEDKEVTQVLIDFALRKLEEDKSWDIALDLNKMAVRLTHENELPHLEKLRATELAQFRTFAAWLRKEIQAMLEQLSTLANGVLDLLEQQQIPTDIFPRGTLPNYFTKRAKGDYKPNKNKLASQITEGGFSLYKKTTPTEIATRVDALHAQIKVEFESCESLSSQIRLYQNILKNIIPVATLHLIDQQLQELKQKENIVLISEFNRLIYDEIKHQPSPYIYERMGDRYRHFFIDEFQDTSLLQWANLMPLIQNALSQEFQDQTSGSLLLVGDAKQSIYRWRGGLPEQFLELTDTNTRADQPAYSTALKHHPKDVQHLDFNYRSKKGIVAFNNAFFGYIAAFLSKEEHQRLYKLGTQQHIIHQEEGFLRVDFISAEDLNHEYCQLTMDAVKQSLEAGYRVSDVCVLTRKTIEGAYISQFLIDNGFAVASEETLLIGGSEVVQLLEHLLTFWLQPDHNMAKVRLLELLYHQITIVISQHAFIAELYSMKPTDFWSHLKTYGIEVSPDVLAGLPLYEACEYFIHQFNLGNDDAYLLGFMEMVLEYSNTRGANPMDFLEYWKDKKDNASLNFGTTTEGVKVMTIHKAKGLEFPVVIFPFADVALYTEIKPTTWYPFEACGFEEVLIDYSSDIANYGADGVRIVEDRRSKLELDHINLLYVALTRAEEALFIFCKDEVADEPKSYNTLLKAYLHASELLDSTSTSYTKGTLVSDQTKKAASDKSTTKSLSYHVRLPDGQLFSPGISISNIEDSQSPNQMLGNLLHDTMEKIRSISDIPNAITALGWLIPKEDPLHQKIERQIHLVTTNMKLAPLFDSSDQVYTERDIITPAEVIRPDRINIHPDGSITLIDYKTGVPKSSDLIQIQHYGTVLEAMNYTLKELLLVYIGETEIVINKG